MTVPCPCYYGLLQYRPDPSREEGLNVGIVVVREPSEVVVKVLDRKDMEHVFDRLRLSKSTWSRAETCVRAFAKRLGAMDDRTAGGLREFAASEVGPVELLSPHAIRSMDPAEIAESLFPQLVL